MKKDESQRDILGKKVEGIIQILGHTLLNEHDKLFNNYTFGLPSSLL
jgi:hypothetical protein